MPLYFYTTVNFYYVIDYVKYLSENPLDRDSFIVVGAGVLIKFFIIIFLHIRNLKYAHLTPIFRLHKIYLVSSTCLHKYPLILYSEIQV